MNKEIILKTIDVLLAGIFLLDRMGVNYREVLEAQEAAQAEGRELNADELAEFVAQAQAAIDKL